VTSWEAPLNGVMSKTVKYDRRCKVEIVKLQTDYRRCGFRRQKSRGTDGKGWHR